METKTVTTFILHIISTRYKIVCYYSIQALMQYFILLCFRQAIPQALCHEFILPQKQLLFIFNVSHILQGPYIPRIIINIKYLFAFWQGDFFIKRILPLEEHLIISAIF